MIYLYILIAVCLTAIINMFFANSNNIFITLLKVSPIIAIQAIFYAMYFKNGIKDHNYGILILISLSLTIIVSYLIQYFYLKQKIENIYEIISILFILIGIGIYIVKRTS